MRELRLHSRDIHRVLNSKREQSGGYEFEFAKQYEEIEGETWRSVVLNGSETGAHVSNKGRFRRKNGIVPWDAWPGNTENKENREV